MPNETKIYRGTDKPIEASGALIANNDVGMATTSYSKTTDGADYPDAEFVMSFTFGAAPVENSSIAVYARPLDIAGTNDAEPPESGIGTFKGDYIGRFLVNNVITLQTARFFARNLPDLANYYAFNNATGQSIAAAWTMEIKPRTLGPV